MIEDNWIKAWNSARPNISIPRDLAFPDDLYYIVEMPQVEVWHDFFLKIMKRIERFFNDQA